MLVEMFSQCGRLDYTLANAVRAEEQRLLAKKPASASPGSGKKPSSAVASSMAVKRPGAEEDDSSSSDEDEDMGGEGEGEGAAGGVDADGWATVTGKKAGRGGRR